MAFLLPLPLPEEAVREHGIVPANDFSHQHLRFVSAGGQHHVVSDLFYNFYRYDSGDNRDYRAFVVTTMDASFSITRVRPLEALTREMTHAPGPDGVERYSFGDEIRCGVTPRGELAFCSRKNRVFVLDAATLERVATYDPLRGGAAGFSDLAPRPGGGLLCSRDRDELLLASAEHALADGVPPLRSIARAYRGARSIAARIEFKPLRPALGELTALADDRVMVPLLADSGRSGWIDDGEFRYVIVDASGEVVGALPLGAADSPYQPKKHPHPECVAHRGLGVWLTRSAQALHVFDRDGERVERIALAEDPAMKNLRHLALLGAAPGGELVLVHRGHHVLVITDPIETIDALGPALAKVSAVYRGEHSRLKKVARGEGGRFLGYEARSTPAAMKPAKTSRRSARARPDASAPEPEPKTPEEACAARPSQLDLRDALARALRGRDDPLGEYLELACQLERLGDDDGVSAERDRLVARVRALWSAHHGAWLRRWNDPIALFDASSERFAGLPSAARLERLPSSLEGLDRQLARLPIRALSIDGLGTRELGTLTALRTLRWVETLIISGSSKRKLGSKAAGWLAAQRLPRLRALQLYRVALDGAGARALLESAPALRELRLTRCSLGAEGLATLSASPAAARVEALALAYNPLGSAGLGALARWTGLRELDLTGGDLGDDVVGVGLDAFTLDVTALRLRGNPRLGARGLAWFVATCPKVQELDVPRLLAPEAVDALRPLSSGLTALNLSGVGAATRRRVLERLLPDATRLRELDLSLATASGLLAPALAGGAVERVRATFGELTDDDLRAIAAAPGAASLRELIVGGTFTDAGATALARSSHLGALRSLELQSGAITARGAAALLESPQLPRLERLMLWGAQLDDVGPLCTGGERVTLRLWKCGLGAAGTRRLRARWGDRLSIG